MTDERIMAAFGRLDLPVEPEPVFAERLFTTLVDGIEWGTMPDRSLRGRIRRALGLAALPTRQRELRLIYMVSIAVLLLPLLAAAIYVASRLLAPTPGELVRLSQQTYEHPPAFSVTYTTSTSGDVTLSSDGAGSWRVEESVYADGSYWLWDGATRVGNYDPQTLVWTAGTPQEVGIVGPPGPLWSEYTWGTGDISSDDPVRHVLPCRGAESLGVATILDRPADRIRCADVDMQYWLDRETHLILRMEGGPNNYHWNTAVVQATSFEVGSQPAEAFDWSGPAAAYSPGNAPATVLLHAGDSLPPWEGTTLAGASFATTSIVGPAVILVVGTWCPPCHSEWDAVSAALKSRPGLRGVIIANDQTGTLTGFEGLHPTTMTLVADPSGTLLTAWGITRIPALVIVRADGRIAGVVGGPNSADDIDLVLDAAVSGAPIPSVPRLPDASATPSPSQEAAAGPSTPILQPDGSGERVTSMSFGSAMPSWGGPLMGGGRFEGSSLLGRPAVIWLWEGTDCASCQNDALGSFATDATRIGDRIGTVIVAPGEPRPGWLSKWLAHRGSTVPVVFDWDGAVRAPFDMRLRGGALVFDAEGRLVDERTTPPVLAELETIADTLSLPSPTPSPAPSPSP